MKNKNIWQLLVTLAFIVILCTFLSRIMTKSNTLYDYAQQNPEIAYAEKNEDETQTLMDTETLSYLEAESDTANTQSPVSEAETAENAICSYPTVEDMNSKENTSMPSAPHKDRITYADGFFYEPITDTVKERILGISYPEDDSNLEISLEELSYVGVLYNDFEGNIQNGELICNTYIALDLVEIFEELYRNGYQFEEIALIDKYDGDDTLSMEHNNTSCFNYRIVDGTTHLSKHAYGLAIDINPFYNPYVVFNKDGTGETYISPKGSEAYADRSKNFPYKIDENDLCYKLFIEHGFTWGGNWNSSKDYQHFQKVK